MFVQPKKLWAAAQLSKKGAIVGATEEIVVGMLRIIDQWSLPQK
jgi:hypothetical protein